MQQTVEPKFSCTACGKQFRWKPDIAGKKGKCACGASVTAPLTAPGTAQSRPKVVVTTTVPKKTAPVAVASKRVAVAAAPQPTPAPPPLPATTDDETYDIAHNDFDGHDISHLNSLLPTPEAIAAAEREAPPVTVGTALPLEYRRSTPPPNVERKYRESRIDPETGEFSDPLRDYLAPAILLALGLAGIAAYMMQTTKAGPLIGLAISIAFVVLLGITVFKTLVLVTVAFPIASYCDVGVGLLRTAFLKLAATILFGDVAILWLITILQAVGMLPKKDDDGPGIWIINVFVLTLIYQVCFWYMFRLSAGDVKFAALMSLVSRLCNFLMLLILLGLISSIRIASHAPPPTASPYIPARQAPLAIPPNAPILSRAGQNTPTAMDDLISQEMRQNPAQFIEGYAWCRLGIASDADKKLISDLYNAGCGKVCVEGFLLYAQLPGDPAKRTASLDIAHIFRKDHGFPDNPNGPTLNYQYLVIELLGKSRGHGN